MISLANSGWLMMKWRYNDECWIINHPEFAKEIINEIIIMVSFIHQCWINVVDHQCWLSAVILAGTGHILAIERCTSTVRFSEGSPAKAFIAERQKEFQRPVDGRWVLQYPVDPMVPVQWVNHQHQQVTKKHIRRLSRLFRVCWFVCLFVCCGFYFYIVVGWSHFAGAFCSDHLIWTVQWSVAAGTGSGWNGSGIWTPYSWWTRNCHMAPCASFWACLCFQRAFPWKHGLIVGTSYGGRL